MSCEKIARVLRIPARYLIYLENNELQKMPAPIYVNGFLKKYSEMLGLDSNRVLKLYEYEFNDYQNRSTSPIGFITSKKTGIVITPKKIIALVTAVAIISIGVYWWKQVTFFFEKPFLTVLYPSQDVQTQEGYIEIEGKTKSGNVVDINEQAVAVTDDGTFKEKVSLRDGLNVLVVTTQDVYGKKNSLTRNVVFSSEKAEKGSSEAENSDASNLTAQAKNGIINSPIELTEEKENSFVVSDLSDKKGDLVTVKIKTQNNASWVKIRHKDSELYSGVLLPGITKSFAVEGEVVLSTDRAENVMIALNGNNFEALGGKGEMFTEATLNKSGVKKI